MASPDLLVVGSGIVGLCCALAARERGLDVLLIDAGVNAGSDTNAGSLHVQLQSRFLRLYPEQAGNVEASLPLYLAAVREWERLDALHGPFELVRKGGLMLAEDAGQLRFLEDKARREAARGLDVDILGRGELERIAPWLGPQIIGAELCRDEGKLNPLTANRLLRAVASARGIGFVRDRILAIDTGRGVDLRGELGRYSADQVVVAAAWGSGALVQPLGLAMPTRAEPLHMNITEPAAAAIHHLVQHAERSITLKQLQTGQIVIGGGWPARARDGGGVPEVLGDSMLGNVALAGTLVPGIGGLRVIRTWAGMNTTIDGKSVIGRIPGSPGVIVAVPGDAGYTLGPLCGRLAAEVASGCATTCDIGSYAPSRFTT